ncbi:hypothetical protein GCM10009117_02690 [Gangjinia marincola]|uniref:Uncharacterized protein n=1 Tax=Gangjinia marincola TaxID=578463 RepID=A0ABN1MDE2_9FLAO
MSTKKNNDLPYNPEFTAQDKKILGEKQNHIRRDNGDDRQLLERENKVDFEGETLDVPSKQQPIAKNPINDEENRLHSQGSEHNENLEQGSGTITS